MKTLILYMTSHGCAGKAADLLRESLPGDVTLVNLEHADPPALENFDAVVIGGSIRIGRIQKKLRRFCDRNLGMLLTKRIGLYICCMYEHDKAREQLRSNYPEALVSHAMVTGTFGGELDFEAMNAVEKMIIRDVIGITVNVSLFREEAVREFTREMMRHVSEAVSQPTTKPCR